MADKGKVPLYVQVPKGTKDIRCPKCKGQVSVEGEMTRQLPIGFGMLEGDPRFRVDSARYKGWYGQCMKCGSEVFAWYTRAMVTRHPAFGGANRNHMRAKPGKTPRLTR